MATHFAKDNISAVTAEAITASDIPNVHGIEIQALNSNGDGFVYWGLTGVTTGTGLQLGKNRSAFISPSFARNASEIFVIGSTAGLDIRVLVL